MFVSIFSAGDILFVMTLILKYNIRVFLLECVHQLYTKLQYMYQQAKMTTMIKNFNSNKLRIYLFLVHTKTISFFRCLWLIDIQSHQYHLWFFSKGFTYNYIDTGILLTRGGWFTINSVLCGACFEPEPGFPLAYIVLIFSVQW